MTRFIRIATIVLVAFLPLTAFGAADLPPWTDDSAVSLTAHPRRFSAARETTNLVGRVYHAIDGPTRISWALTVSDWHGTELRHFSAQQTFAPGEAMQPPVPWKRPRDHR